MHSRVHEGVVVQSKKAEIVVILKEDRDGALDLVEDCDGGLNLLFNVYGSSSFLVLNLINIRDDTTFFTGEFLLDCVDDR